MKRDMYFDEEEMVGEDLRPNYSLYNTRVIAEEMDFGATPEELKKWAQKEKEALERRERIINERPQFFNEVQMIDVDKIGDEFKSWNYFSWPTKMEQVDLARSIENIGLLNPIYITSHSDGSYNVICGRCRLIAYCNLYVETGLEKYKNIPCYVIPYKEVDELYIRSMMIESNICFRRITKYNLISALIINYEIMKKTKQFRNESNIGMELAKQFNISESTVFNFLKVKELCDPGLKLLYDGDITLQAATYLTRVSKETQVNILKTCGVKGVNIIFKLKLLTKKENMTIDEIKNEIKRIEELTPETTKIIIEVHKALFGDLLELLLNFKENNASVFAGKNFRGNFHSVFTTRFKREDIKLYQEKGIIDEITLKRLQAKNVPDLFKIKA